MYEVWTGSSRTVCMVDPTYVFTLQTLLLEWLLNRSLWLSLRGVTGHILLFFFLRSGELFEKGPEDLHKSVLARDWVKGFGSWRAGGTGEEAKAGWEAELGRDRRLELLRLGGGLRSRSVQASRLTTDLLFRKRKE